MHKGIKLLTYFGVNPVLVGAMVNGMIEQVWRYLTINILSTPPVQPLPEPELTGTLTFDAIWNTVAPKLTKQVILVRSLKLNYTVRTIVLLYVE